MSEKRSRLDIVGGGGRFVMGEGVRDVEREVGRQFNVS